MGRYTVTVIGPKNSFGTLDGPTTPVSDLALQGVYPARGESLRCVDSPLYDTHPGQVHYFTAFAPNGNVVVICGSQSNNPLSNTATDCQVLALDPKTLRWQTVQIPTVATASPQTGGKWIAVGSNGITGGMDCADVGVYNAPGDPFDQNILVMTFATYSGYNIGAAGGEFPIFALLSPYTGPNTADPANGRVRDWGVGRTVTAKNILDSDPTKAAGIYETKAGNNGSYTDAKAPGEFAQFPQSHHVVFGHYFPWNGGTSGAFSVVNPTNGGHELQATYKMPNCTGPGLPGWNGSPYLWCAPREIECDPSSSLGDERFTVLYDTYPYAGLTAPGANPNPAGPSAPHLLQEFSYNANTGTITPVSGFVNVLQDDQPPTSGPLAELGPGGPVELGTMRFDGDGNLFVTCNTIYSLQPNNPMAVFLKKSGERDTVRNCPASSGWETRYNSAKLTPDFYVPATGRNSACSFSHDVDSSRRNVLTVGLNGVLTVVNWDSGFPVSGNLLPSLDQLNSTGASAPGALPFVTAFGSAQLSWAKFNGKWGLKMVSNFANAMTAITPNIGGLSPGRQYRIRAEFAAGVGSIPVRCQVKVDSFDAAGNFLGVQEQFATFSSVDAAVVNSDGTMNGPTVISECDFDCLDRTDHITIQLFPTSTSAGQVHYVQNLSMVQLPFTRRAVVDLGVNQMRNTATPSPTLPINGTANPLQIRKSCFDVANNKLYTPAGFLGQQIFGPVTAPPPTPHQIAQYVICTDVGNLGAAAPTDQLVQDHIVYSGNMDTAYHSQSYPWSLPAGDNAAMCGFVVNIPIAVYPFNFGYTAWSGLGGGIIGAPCAAAIGEGQEFVFVRRTDSALCYRYQHGPTTDGWVSLGGTCMTDPVAVVEPVPALGTTGYNVHVFVVGRDNQVWQITRNPLGVWGGWTPRGGYIYPSMQGPGKTLAAACLGTGKLDVYACTGSNWIYHLSLRSGAWSWSQPLPGGYGDGRISAWGEVASNGGRVWLTSTQANGSTMVYSLTNGGWVGAGAGNIGGNTTGHSSIVGTKTPNEVGGTHLSLDVLTVGFGGTILWRNHYQSWVPPNYGAYRSVGWSGYQQVPLLPSGGFAAVSVGACVGFHDQKDPNGISYLAWDAYITNTDGTGAYGLSYAGS